MTLKNTFGSGVFILLDLLCAHKPESLQVSDKLRSTLISVCSTGICVRCDMDSVYMHHKFAVVDGRRLISGSLNWTLAAVQSNLENVLITEETNLVQPFIKEFQRLWVRNDPERHLQSNEQKPVHVATMDL